MIKFNRLLVIGLLAFVAPFVNAAEEMSAVESARTSVNELLAKVEELKPYFESDRDRYFSGIQESLSNFVDFDEVAIGVMARYSEQASAEQISRFGDKLKSTLTRFYGAALVGYPSRTSCARPRRKHQCTHGDLCQQ